jgi:hypothetical protein
MDLERNKIEPNLKRAIIMGLEIVETLGDVII